jgi:hypothetical protein
MTTPVHGAQKPQAILKQKKPGISAGLFTNTLNQGSWP